MPPALRPAIFLDRDGVIIENRPDHVRAWADVSFLPGALPALARLAAREFLAVIITNQAAVGRGLISLAAAEALNTEIIGAIRRAGGRIDGAYLCPHRPDEGCPCRKPRPGLIWQAARDLGVNLAASYFIGDAASDVQAALAAGVAPALVLTGRGAEQQAQVDGQARVFAVLAAALDALA